MFCGFDATVITGSISYLLHWWPDHSGITNATSKEVRAQSSVRIRGSKDRTGCENIHARSTPRRKCLIQKNNGQSGEKILAGEKFPNASSLR
jgi:hypothetical protein